MGAGIGAILFTLTTGLVVENLHSYTPILITAGLLPVLGTSVFFLVGGPIRRVGCERFLDEDEKSGKTGEQ